LEFVRLSLPFLRVGRGRFFHRNFWPGFRVIRVRCVGRAAELSVAQAEVTHAMADVHQIRVSLGLADSEASSLAASARSRP
jgi:hypothetical protein